MAEPPSLVGGLNFTSILESDPATFVMLGAPGRPRGITAAEDTDATLDPALFEAVTAKV
jgi:hypothetical protein